MLDELEADLATAPDQSKARLMVALLPPPGVFCRQHTVVPGAASSLITNSIQHQKWANTTHFLREPAGDNAPSIGFQLLALQTQQHISSMRIGMLAEAVAKDYYYSVLRAVIAGSVH